MVGLRIEATLYDGHTKYDVRKSKEEQEAKEKLRLERCAKWFEAEEGKLDKDGEESPLQQMHRQASWLVFILLTSFPIGDYCILSKRF